MNAFEDQASKDETFLEAEFGATSKYRYTENSHGETPGFKDDIHQKQLHVEYLDQSLLMSNEKAPRKSQYIKATDNSFFKQPASTQI